MKEAESHYTSSCSQHFGLRGILGTLLLNGEELAEGVRVARLQNEIAPEML